MNTFQIYEARKANSTTIWLLFLFLGWSYGSMEQMGKQILFYITAGGLGFWLFYRLFTLNGAIKKFNKQIAQQAGMTSDDLLKLGLI